MKVYLLIVPNVFDSKLGAKFRPVYPKSTIHAKTCFRREDEISGTSISTDKFRNIKCK